MQQIYIDRYADVKVGHHHAFSRACAQSRLRADVESGGGQALQHERGVVAHHQQSRLHRGRAILTDLA